MSVLPGKDGLRRVLVVGANSYIGDSFAKYAKMHERLYVDISDSYEGWKAVQFHDYDSVVMVAGLAHQKWNRKQQQANKDMYFAINHDLAVSVAKKAKADGVGHFIYLSSMAVFGQTEGVIAPSTIIAPRDTDYYGQSKYKAEAALMALFGAGICIVRPPMVYGPGCPGKFASLLKVAKKLPFIPSINNCRSMIFIDNLCEFLCLTIEQQVSGIFHPHNKEYMNTTWLIKAASNAMGKRARVMPGLGLLVRCIKPFSSLISTAFSSLYYDNDITVMPLTGDYQLVSAIDSIEQSIE